MGYMISFIKEIEKYVETFFIADTLGCLTPHATYNIVSVIKNNCNCKLGLHAHNDFGLATANTLEGILAGADIFSGTFTGIGERSGNAPIEEVCIALKFTVGIDIDVRYGMIKELCDIVERFSRIPLQAHKPVVGKNSFCHESGIHVDGMLKDPKTYENFDPSVVGQKRSFMLGKHSGKKLLRQIMGEDASEESIDQALNNIKVLSETRKISFPEENMTDISLTNKKVKIK